MVAPASRAARLMASSPTGRVDRDRHADPLRKHRHTTAAVGTDDFVRDEDVVAQRSRDLGLEHRRAGQTGARSRCELAAGDLRRLVRLEVRAQLAPAGREELGHLLYVALERVDVHDERRRQNVKEAIWRCHDVEVPKGSWGPETTQWSTWIVDQFSRDRRDVIKITQGNQNT